MLNEQVIRTVKATAPAVAQHAEAITRRFYTVMFREDPQVQGFFNQAHQHSGGQQRALAGAICAYAANIDNLAALGPAVELIAHKHGSLGIRAEHYPIVGKHLLTAIKDVLGDAATDEILSAWGAAYTFLADVLVGREMQIYRDQASAHGGWNGYRKFAVQQVEAESQIITSFYLRPVDGGPLAAFKPGQYITVRIDHPAAPAALRNYSLSDRPDTGHYRISVKRESGADADSAAGLVSTFLHDRVRPGDAIELGPPCGNFTLDLDCPEERPLVLACGGIGITPLLSMLKSLAHRRVARPITFIQGALDSRVHAFAGEVRAAAGQAANVRTHIRYSAPLTDDLAQGRCDSVGMIDGALLDELQVPADAEFFFCGPKPFMAAFYRDLTARGTNECRIHYEYFGPRGDIGAGV